MKRVVIGIVGLLAIAMFSGAAFGQMGWRSGPAMMGSGSPCGGMMAGQGMMGNQGMMGPGMMGGQGATAAPQSQLTDESAKQLAQQYADRYLKGFTVDKVLPFTGMRGMTMYQAELKGPAEEVRTLHINPWGNVMPFGGPSRQG